MSIERRRRRCLPAVLQNPATVLTLGVLILGAAILLTNESVIREQAELQELSAGVQADTLAISFRDRIGTELAAVESILRIASLVARQDGIETAAVRVARMVAARSGTPTVLALLDGGGDVLFHRAADGYGGGDDPARYGSIIAATTRRPSPIRML